MFVLSVYNTMCRYYLQEMSGDPLTSAVNESTEEVENRGDADSKTERESGVIMEDITGADEAEGDSRVAEDEREVTGGAYGLVEEGGVSVVGVGLVEEGGGSVVEEGGVNSVEEGGVSVVEGEGVSVVKGEGVSAVEREKETRGGERREEEEGGRDEMEEGEKETFSDVNLTTPTSDMQGLEFFDHNITSSDSSGAPNFLLRPLNTQPHTVQYSFAIAVCNAELLGNVGASIYIHTALRWLTCAEYTY